MTGVNGLQKVHGVCNINNDLPAKSFRPPIMIVPLVLLLLGVAITIISPNTAASAKPFAVSFLACFAVMTQLFSWLLEPILTMLCTVAIKLSTSLLVLCLRIL
jgi:apolipoprotein N-acyltransferase